MKKSGLVDCLKQGVSVWNAWRSSNPGTTIDLSGVDFTGLSLAGIDLHTVDLRGSNFSRADLVDADLRGSNLQDVNFSRADLTRVRLIRSDIRWSNFSKADLRNADFRRADASNTLLFAAQALGTDFSHATLTGACLEDWNINSQTCLDNVICDYVYISSKGKERRPRHGNFQSGEFAALFRVALETVELVFLDGIDWKAFFSSFNEIREKYGSENISVQGIESKRDGAFVVRLETAASLSKAVIENEVKTRYTKQLQALQATYQANLKAKESEIQLYREQNSNLVEIMRVMASRPINVEAVAVSQSNAYSISQSNPEITQTAQELQNLVLKITQHADSLTLAEQIHAAAEVAQEVEKRPELRNRIVNALKAIGIEAFKELFDNPVFNIAAAGLEAWRTT